MLNIDLSKDWGIVVYTDGGARPNPGASGTGLFGYVYEMGTEALGSKSLRFTSGDTACYAMPTTTGLKYSDKAGVFSSTRDKDAKVVKPLHYFEGAMSSSGRHTNNYAELNGVYQSFLLAESIKAKALFILADSMYVLEGLTKWCNGWSRNGWVNRAGEPIANQDLWKATYEKFMQLRDNKVAIGLTHVKGHADHPGNVQADMMATIGVIKSQDLIDDSSFITYTAKEYWEPKRDRHPLMSLKRIYFDRLGENYKPGLYFMADPGKDDALIGKPLPETVFAVVKLDEPDPIVSSVIQKQHKYGQDFNEVMMIKVENLFTPDAFRTIGVHGQYAMLRTTSGGCSVDLADNRPLTIERKPIGITMRAIDSLNSLKAIFDSYEEFVKDPEEFEKNNNRLLQRHDLTHEFYEFSEKKVGKETRKVQSLQKRFGTGHKDHKVKIELKNVDGSTQSREITLKLSLDLPERNMLKQLDALDASVELITWRESELSVRYATVIRCTGGAAIWSNFYADRLILKK